MIGMPLGFDQPDNLAFLVNRGAAEPLSPWADVNETVRTIKSVIGKLTDRWSEQSHRGCHLPVQWQCKND